MAVLVTDIETLRKPTEAVKEGEDISEIVDSLFKELKEFNALGLAANQLGYTKSIFVMKMDALPPICLVNPVIIKQKGKQVREEMCLSMPGTIVIVERPEQVTIKGMNQYFKFVRYKFTGFHARKACHEIDHLLGKLITDYEIIDIISEEDFEEVCKALRTVRLRKK